MKKNLFLRIAAVLIVTALFATCILSGTTTLAMYTAQATGTASAQIAKWSIEVNDEEIATGTVKSLTVDLLNPILCRPSAAYLGGTQAATSEEKHVTAEMIAPGTYGEMGALKLENLSNVDAKFDITVVIDTASLPAGFANLVTKGAFVVTKPVDDDALAAKLTASAGIIGTPTATIVTATGVTTATISVNLAKLTGTTTIAAGTLGWEWFFSDTSVQDTFTAGVSNDDNDGVLPNGSNFDTPIGIAATSSHKLSAAVTVTATQID